MKRIPWNYAQVKKTCSQCGKLFLLAPSKANRSYCSKSCFYIARFGGFNLQTNCAECGKEMRVNAWRLKNRGFLTCSRKCRHKHSAKRLLVRCSFCKIKFEKKRSQHVRSYYHFCTHKCSQQFHIQNNHPGFVGGMNYGREWKIVSKQIRDRDKVCQRCGKTPKENRRQLDVHHRSPFSKFGYKNRLDAHVPSNLVALCRACHTTVENHGLCV